MKSMKYSLILCFLVAAFALQAQEVEGVIKKDINTYFDLLGEQKISEALDMVHPELLAMIGKDVFLAQYEEMFNTPGISITMGDLKINSVSPVFNHDSKDYSLVDYQFIMTFQMDMSEDKDGLLKGILMGSYGRQYGTENVTFEDPDKFVITVKKEMIAVNAEGYPTWKILDIDEGMKMILVAFVPKEVFTHFNR